MIEDAYKHLIKDPALNGLIRTIGLRPPGVESDVYRVLLRSIVGQQLSTKAADTIWTRFLLLFPDGPSPEAVLRLTAEQLRPCGLSFQKAGYVHNIARFALENDLGHAYFNTLGDDEALDHLTQVKGVGRWTAEMILMFSLGRADVFPVDDLGIRNAMVNLYGLKTEKRQLITDLQSIAEGWRPYRTFACNLLWDWKDGAVNEWK